MPISRRLSSALPMLLLSPTLMAATVADGHIQHVLLFSVDGLHEVDLANFVAAHPTSALARLSAMGTTYTHASCSSPSDSFPGLGALVTGAKPADLGLWYDDAWDRSLFAPGSTVRGVETNLSESLDWDNSYIDGGAKHFGKTTMIDPSHLPVDAAGHPVFPHQLLRTNTIFEVAKSAGLRTAWTDKHPAYEWVNGPSGTGVDDLFTPEINSFLDADGNPLVDTLGAPLPIPGPASAIGQGDITSSVAATTWYDGVKVAAILNQIQGKSSSGAAGAGVPAIFGMNFQSVSVGQKVANDPLASSGPRGGYADAAGTPNAPLATALAFVDTSLGQVVAGLQTAGILDSTLIIVTAKHGQAPIDPATLRMLKPIPALGITESVQDPVPQDAGGAFFIATTSSGIPVDFAIEDDASLIWLHDQSQTAAAVTALQAVAGPCHIQSILSGADLKAQFSDPLTDARVPDIIIQPIPGTVYAGIKKKRAEHGGSSEDDTHVALLVANARLAASTVTDPVSTRQVAPTIVKAIGLDPHALQAVQKGDAAVLGGLGTDGAAPPQRIGDLSATAVSTTGVRLAWTSPVDGSPAGRAAAYDVRVATSPITADSFAAATPVTGAPVPASAGVVDQFTASGLQAGTTYFFAVKGTDSGLAAGMMSNVATATTATASGDGGSSSSKGCGHGSGLAAFLITALFGLLAYLNLGARRK